MATVFILYHKKPQRNLIYQDPWVSFFLPSVVPFVVLCIMHLPQYCEAKIKLKLNSRPFAGMQSKRVCECILLVAILVMLHSPFFMAVTWFLVLAHSCSSWPTSLLFFCQSKSWRSFCLKWEMRNPQQPTSTNQQLKLTESFFSNRPSTLHHFPAAILHFSHILCWSPPALCAPLWLTTHTFTYIRIRIRTHSPTFHTNGKPKQQTLDESLA